jgi:protein phosphatase-4 regulatory subunit 3
MQEDFFIKHLTEKRILGPILEVLTKAISRDNLLSSASLELFEYIKKENIKDLVKHLVENHRERLLSLSYLSTFRDLVLRYDQTQGYTANMDYFLDTEHDVGRKPPPGARMMEHIAVDPAEEEYWNSPDPDDEDDHSVRPAAKTPAGNGSSTPSRPLVDYPSDEEGDENADPNAEENRDDSSDDNTRGTEPNLPSVAPPERLAEKRRREEDDEDELDKLMHNKLVGVIGHGSET